MCVKTDWCSGSAGTCVTCGSCVCTQARVLTAIKMQGPFWDALSQLTIDECKCSGHPLAARSRLWQQIPGKVLPVLHHR